MNFKATPFSIVIYFTIIVICTFNFFGKEEVLAFLKAEFSVSTFLPWFFTVATAIMYFVERRKNSKTSIALALQGLLGAAEGKRIHHESIWGTNVKERVENKDYYDEYLTYSRMVLTDYAALVEELTGYVESLEVEVNVIDSSKYTDNVSIIRDYKNGTPQSTT